MKGKNTLKNIGIISGVAIFTAALTVGVMTHTGSGNLAKTEQVVPQEAVSEQVTPVQTISEDSEVVASNLAVKTSVNNTESYIGEAEAKAIALAHVGLKEADVSYMLCKLDYDDGIAEYEVEFWDGTTEYDYEVNAISGEIIGYDHDMESYDTKPVTTPDTTATTSTSEYIGEVEAKAIALAHAGVTETEATRLKCEFDFDDGYAEYEVEWEIGRMEYEYTISATDGTIWEHDVEYDD